MSRKITFNNMVFLGVNSKEYRSKEGQQKQSFTAKLFDVTTNDTMDYFIRDVEKVNTLKQLPQFAPCNLILAVSVFNGQAGLMLDDVEILEKKK